MCVLLHIAVGCSVCIQLEAEKVDRQLTTTTVHCDTGTGSLWVSVSVFRRGAAKVEEILSSGVFSVT